MSAQPELDDLRHSFQERGLSRQDMAEDPFVAFQQWFDEAAAAGVHEPEAMVVSTVGDDDRPSSRYVLLKGLDHGFVFFTNYLSRKGQELTDRPRAAVCFPWHVLGRQVRVSGWVEQVTAAESDAYFASRPRGSQVGAWASAQSEVLARREVLEERWASIDAQHEGRDVPRPPHWGGYRVVPVEIELWQGRRSRLHDRFRYALDPSSPTGWRLDRLSP